MLEMVINTERVSEFLRDLDLNRLFVDEFGWAEPGGSAVHVCAGAFGGRLEPIAERGQMVAFEVQNASGVSIPDLATRKSIHEIVGKQTPDHVLVFVNGPRTATLWSWPDMEDANPPRPNEHRFHIQQPADDLIQSLVGLAFNWDDLHDEDKTSIIPETSETRAACAANAEQVTKDFYGEFRFQPGRLGRAIDGIEEEHERDWYAVAMLSRLMFLQFIQTTGALDGDAEYLRNRLERCREAGTPYYRGLLLPLFLDGLRTRPEERSDETDRLLGEVPHLSGGLFEPNEIELA